ncbi:MAG TPA: hypothetical protein V6D10_10895 [Trichocoleus sp.]|jgi:hypothetical protein
MANDRWDDQEQDEAERSAFLAEPGQVSGDSISLHLMAQESLQPQENQANSWYWLQFGLGTCGALGGIVTVAFLWLAALPPATDCQKISSFSPDIERLQCAQQAAQSGKVTDLVAGLKLVAGWSADHPLYPQARRWMAAWSESLLAAARQKQTQNDLQGAIELVRQIPQSSPVHADGQAQIKKWQVQQQASAEIYAKAQQAIQQADWETASQQIIRLGELANTSLQQVNALSQQVLAEKAARRLLAQAKAATETGNPAGLKGAIGLANQIDPKTYAWAEAKSHLQQWSETLLQVGFKQWQAKRLDEAIDLAKGISPHSTLVAESQNLIKLSQARQQAVTSLRTWQVSPGDILRLTEAIAAARQIAPSSRFYGQAQDSLKSWEAQLQDVIQLQYAQMFASLAQHSSLEVAITQAKQIPIDRTRRLQAQTLVAHWTGEVERIEDRPILATAQKLAQPETISALKAAIAAASQIPVGRMLRTTAQELVENWTTRIGVLEDQPILTLAQNQADQGNLRQAIGTIGAIQPNRPLYQQAQAAILSWQEELWRIENPTPPRASAPIAAEPFSANPTPEPIPPRWVEDAPTLPAPSEPSVPNPSNYPEPFTAPSPASSPQPASLSQSPVVVPTLPVPASEITPLPQPAPEVQNPSPPIEEPPPEASFQSATPKPPVPMIDR